MSQQSLHVRDVLSRDEIRDLTRASNWRGALSLVSDWAVIAGSFALVAHQPDALTILAALVLIGGRQLGLSVLMHECSHRSLFRSRALNEILGRWVIAAPVWTDLDRYRKHHMKHHNHTGTEADPDLGLVTPFPAPRRSMIKRFARDLSGVTGLKRLFGLLLMDFGFIEYTASVDVRRIDQSGRGVWDVVKTGARNLTPVVLTNALLFGALALLGHGWLYLLWVGAYLTTFSLFVRVRSMAEHACTERSADFFRNSRTTEANALSRLVVAPLNVNYHLEHHLLMTVPHYNLRRMRALLDERGALRGTHSASGYLEVLRQMVSPRPSSGA